MNNQCEEKPGRESLESWTGVERVVAVDRPYKLVAREAHPEGSVVRIRGLPVGGREVVVMAGPCAVESRDQIERAAEGVAAAGAKVLRGGVFKPRTSSGRIA